MDFSVLFKNGSALLSEPMNLGPLTGGEYIKVGINTGFYVPKADYDLLKTKADETGKLQFLGVTKSGAPIHGTREEILDHPESVGLVAWIKPEFCQW
jgi:hypothetical protein